MVSDHINMKSCNMSAGFASSEISQWLCSVIHPKADASSRCSAGKVGTHGPWLHNEGLGNEFMLEVGKIRHF
jgi:hypothetical protein